MKLFRLLLHRYFEVFSRRPDDIKEQDKRILNDVGIKKMDIEYRKDARLWQKLAS